jgi:hypothetical protein
MSAVDRATEQASAPSQLREWRRLLGTLLLVLAPVLVLAGAVEGLAWCVGETVPMSMTSTWQDGAPDRIWRAGDGHSYLPYKLARVADLKPEIVVLGPSRANEFRGDLFAPYTFYNAGLTAWTFDQYRRFLDLVARDGYAPKVLVFNLDYWMFSAGFDHYWADRFDEKPPTHVSSLLRVIGQMREDPRRLWHVLPDTGRRHGLLALLSGEGFGADGSLSGRAGAPDAQRLLDDGTSAGTPPVALADRIEPEQVAKFDQFVALAKAKHVALVGVQLPYYQKILNGLNDNSEAGIWREFEGAEWQQRLAAAGVLFFDCADMPEYRDKPEYFIDSLDPDTRVVNQVTKLVLADPRMRSLLPKVAAQ